MTVIQTITFTLTLFLICLILGIAVVFVVWLFKIKKIRKGIPGNMEEIIEKEKKKIQEVLKYEEKNRRGKRFEIGDGGFEEAIRGFGQDTEGIESVEGSDKLNDNKELVKERQGVQIPDTIKPKRKKQPVKLHKPTAL